MGPTDSPHPVDTIEQQGFHTEIRSLVHEGQEVCPNRSVTLVCNGRACAARAVPPGTLETLKTTLRRPLLPFEIPLQRFGVPVDLLPCARVRRDLAETDTVLFGPDAHGQICTVFVRGEVGPHEAARLCGPDYWK